MRILHALVLAMALIAGAAAAHAESLGGLVLAASEDMADPRFKESVIYLVDHDDEGAFGLIVNKPFAVGPIAALLERFDIDLGDDDDIDAVSGSITVHYGGPVETGLGFVLHSPEYAIKGTRVVAGEIAFTTRPEVLRDMALGRGPRRSLLAFGYSGWGPAQLERELARGDWAVVEADPDLVLGTDHETKWHRALGRRPGDVI